MATAEKLEEKHPGKFLIGMKSDPGVTGRLEVTIYFNTKNPKEGEGVVVHSKANGDDFTYKNWNKFLAKVADAIKEHDK